ncbi:MAG: hypothetical protein ACI9XO_002585 [Paraglaciecola sp.]
MSKKRFTDGLESIFGEVHEETFDRGLLVEEKEDKTAAQAKSTTSTPKKRSSRKNFTTDLDSLFDGSLSEVVEEKLQGQRVAPRKNLNGKSKSIERTQRARRPLSGLDALIRQTLDSGSLTYDPNAKKRISFTCDKVKLDKLKKIARQEKAYLKDILGDIVASFITDYESTHG